LSFSWTTHDENIGKRTEPLRFVITTRSILSVCEEALFMTRHSVVIVWSRSWRLIGLWDVDGPIFSNRNVAGSSRWGDGAGHVARMEEKRDAYRLLMGKPEGKRPLGRPSRRWVNNIGRILERSDGVMWTGWVWLRIVFGIEPSVSIKFWETIECPNNWWPLQ
jgi:hypothetical protein